MRGVFNHPQRFIKVFRGVLNRLCRYLNLGFETFLVGTYDGGLGPTP